MTGRTGYTAYDDDSAYDPAAHVTDVASHFDALIGETVDTASNLPTSGNWVGREIMAEDTLAIYRCTALPNTWRRVWSVGTPYAEASGEASTTGVAGGSSSPFFWSGNESVTFPVGRFSVAPLVTASPAGNTSGSIFPGVQIHDITTSGFTFKVFRIGAAPATGTKIHWRAVQMLPSAAAG